MSAHDLLMAAAGGASTPPDPQFNYVTMLLHGDGTNGAQNNTFVDSSSTAFSITPNGNITQGAFSPFAAPQGYWGVVLDGSSAFTAPSGLQTAFAGWGGRTRSFECWIYRQSGVDGSLQNAYWGVAANGRWQMGIGTDNKLGLGWTTSTSTQTYVGTTASVPSGWSHVAVCVNSTTASNTTIYLAINGVVETFTGKDFSTQTSSFGWQGMFDTAQYSSPTFKGAFTGLRWSNNVRYTSNFSVPTAPFVNDANTLFLLGQNRNFIDESSNAYVVTASAGVPMAQPISPLLRTREAYLPSVNGGSAYYDGTGDWTYTSNNSAFQVAANQAFTIEAWVYPFQLTDTGDVVSYCAPIAAYENDWGWELTLTGGVVRVTGVGWYYPQFPSSLQVGAWNHIVMKRDTNGTLTCYLNGVAGTPVAASTGAITPYIQQYSWAVTLNTGINVANWTTPQNLRYLKGYVSDVRYVVGSAITPPAGGPTAPLATVANTVYHLKTQNAGIYDNAMMNDLETVGNAQISTGVKKYGTRSIAFDGTGDCLCLPVGQNWALGDYVTIEGWFYFNSVNAGTGGALISTYDYFNGTEFGWFLILNSSAKLQFSCFGNGGSYNHNNDVIGLTGSTTITTGQWYHIALVKNGSSWKIYLNGVSDASGTSSGTNTEPRRLGIGVSFTGNGSQTYYIPSSYIDDLRITKGVARYTANFTPPTAAFSDK